MPIFSLHPSPHHPPSPLFPNPLPHPSPSPLSPNPLPHTSPPSLSPTRLPQRPLPTRLPCPAFPHLSPTLHTPHPYPSLPRLSPNTSLNLFPKPLPQTSRPTRSPTPFPPRLPPVPPLHASFQHLPLSRLGHTPLPHRLPPPCPDPAGRSQLARRQWDPVASAKLADETAAEQSTSRALGVRVLCVLFPGSEALVAEHNWPAMDLGVARLLSSSDPIVVGLVEITTRTTLKQRCMMGLFSRRKAKMTTIITSPSGHLTFSLAGSVLRLL
ncbi:unnamed protein product [Closterium sp. NIES-64]|nr:unnamed protein product [Closterium sp. NIES-64]